MLDLNTTCDHTCDEMEAETKQAIRLLQAEKARDCDGQLLTWLKNRLFSQISNDFTTQELNRVLADVVESDGSVGLVKALLSLGADVNFFRRPSSHAWSKMTQRHPGGERNDILLRATIRCRPETVSVLASRADQANLDSALHHAIVRRDLRVIATLLEHGANPAPLHDDFQNLIYHNQIEIVKLLLSGHHLPCLACRSTALRIAVECRSLEILQLLLKHWADVNYRNAIALIRAVETGRLDFVATLLSGTVRASPRSLDTAIGRIWQLIDNRDDDALCDILDLCLSAGASGSETTHLVTDGFLELISKRKTRFVETILHHKQLPEQFGAAALVEAMRTEQLGLMRKLLELRPTASTLSTALSYALSISIPKVQQEAIRMLIDAGAKGSCAADALVKIVHSLVAGLRYGDKVSIARDQMLFRLLLHEGEADVNFAKGEALQIAVRSGCVDVVEQMVAKGPSPQVLGAALSWAMELVDRKQKHCMVEALLRRPLDPDAAGKALLTVFQTDPDDV